MEKIKDRLYSAMSTRDVKAVELSEKTGIPKASLSQYLSGYTEPRSDRIYLLSKALSVNPAWLMGYDVPMEDNKELKDEIMNLFDKLTSDQQEAVLNFLRSMTSNK